MSYEVELLKAWMVQGHRTEYDGTPIPPVMPEPTPTGEPVDHEALETDAEYEYEYEVLAKALRERDDARALVDILRDQRARLLLGAAEPTPLPEGARASVSDDAVFSPDEHSVHFEVSMVVDGDPAEFASRAHAWLAAVLYRAKDA